ncbi:hypothetical protein DGI_2182 [Megalodesulfovibrio gigas DSM 1382 = ATCC 19364]|uniref:Lipoprotein n=1 Tax=Megalodesulfovibrio gigas (strain ATCC 19364 / DSM 1382 / NCIMB 9332 / VKM B-1759) TaxID=1121448 RepID=T2GBH6_MEGG1|nr:hypothetical protein DGI_2182 [Megalodesulfovibrio gigas DSM 1382 = ATCC 19364]
MRVVRAVLLLGVALGLASGCAQSRPAALHGVAKGWSETLRACQLIPVYPLTEDLRPGDVFLVETTAQHVQEDYRSGKLSFLPLDQHVVRLAMNATIYPDMYRDHYFTCDFGKAPHNPAGAAAEGSEEKTLAAPRAAFPMFSFSVDRGSGLDLALPIQSVPLAFGLMGSDNATGTITIDDAFTYFVQGQDLLVLLRNWYDSNPIIKDMFCRMANSSKKPLFLRVISRVYLARSVQVDLVNTGESGGGLAAGTGLPALTTTSDYSGKNAGKAAAEAANSLNEELAGAGTATEESAGAGTTTPKLGGNVKFLFASNGLVSLHQKFDRPLAIGYLGFDVPLCKDGSLGVPIGTFSQLEGLIDAQNNATDVLCTTCPK